MICMKKTTLVGVACAVAVAASAQTRFNIDAASIKAHIPSLIYGSGMEDVNHEIYGGLYDQRIFGESMEEPATSAVKGFLQYDSPWAINDDVLELHTGGHGKIVCQNPYLQKGTVSVDVRVDGSQAISGLIFNVSEAGAGADAFIGYEVSLDAAKKVLVVGRHRHNWSKITEVPVEFETKEWNTMRVDFEGGKASIYINDNKLYDLNDTAEPISGGLVGLRSYGGSAAYRNLTIDGAPVSFTAEATDARGFRQYDDKWAVSAGVLSTQATHCAKIVHVGKDLSQGSAEVEMRIDGDRSISGFIIDVTEAANGDDNFRGYEIAVNSSSRVLVVGKHEHDWQPIANVPVDINPREWNTLHVDFDGDSFIVKINNDEVYTYKDENQPLMQGKIGMRTFDGPVSFRNLKINDNAVALETMPVGVSGMWDAVGNGTYAHTNIGAAHGSYAQKIEGAQGDGICNFGLNKWGIGVKEGQQMQGYVYLKGTAAGAYVALQSADGSVEYARHNITGISSEWNKYEFTLTPSATDTGARFVVALDAEGTLWADMAMLHTENYPYRKDITDAFLKENLTFLRYGGTMINAAEYMTGNMLGDADKRPPYTGHWYTYSTNGFGIKEFVEFARLIGTEPTFSINIEDNPDDVLKMLKAIEKHNLAYIEIGNEENIGDDSKAAYEHYVERFLTLYNAIHPVYPDLQFINAAWWRSDKLDIMEYVFKSLDGKSTLWDYHPWTEEVAQARQVETDLNNMKNLFLKWNPDTDMRVAILEENGNTHDMHRALAHAVVLNVVRKMDGFVQLDSPANALQPYLQNDNGWDQGQIFFNSSEVWCQPPYYVQQVEAAHHQPLLVNHTCSNRNLNITATANEDGTVVVAHVVNSAGSTQRVKLSLTNASVISAKMITVSGDLGDRNTPQDPEHIVPQESKIEGDVISLPPHSYNMIEIHSTVPTGIAGVKDGASNDAEETYYSLSGIKTKSPRNGIYIRENGEKVVM